jgi:hypothetical protein
MFQDSIVFYGIIEWIEKKAERKEGKLLRDMGAYSKIEATDKPK